MIDFLKLPSPCYVLDEELLDRNLATVDRVRRESGAEIIVALKACAGYDEAAVQKYQGVYETRKAQYISEFVNADGTVNVTKTDAPLVTNAGEQIVAAGGASVEDGVITGSMNYFVEGVVEG